MAHRNSLSYSGIIVSVYFQPRIQTIYHHSLFENRSHPSIHFTFTKGKASNRRKAKMKSETRKMNEIFNSKKNNDAPQKKSVSKDAA